MIIIGIIFTLAELVTIQTNLALGRTAHIIYTFTTLVTGLIAAYRGLFSKIKRNILIAGIMFFTVAVIGGIISIGLFGMNINNFVLLAPWSFLYLLGVYRTDMAEGQKYSFIKWLFTNPFREITYTDEEKRALSRSVLFHGVAYKEFYHKVHFKCLCGYRMESAFITKGNEAPKNYYNGNPDIPAEILEQLPDYIRCKRDSGTEYHCNMKIKIKRPKKR